MIRMKASVMISAKMVKTNIHKAISDFPGCAAYALVCLIQTEVVAIVNNQILSLDKCCVDKY